MLIFLAEILVDIFGLYLRYHGQEIVSFFEGMGISVLNEIGLFMTEEERKAFYRALSKISEGLENFSQNV